VDGSNNLFSFGTVTKATNVKPEWTCWFLCGFYNAKGQTLTLDRHFETKSNDIKEDMSPPSLRELGKQNILTAQL